MNNKLHLVTVYGVMINPENEILIVQRSEHDTFPLMWEFPGGSVEMNENPQDATIREVFEEIGIQTTPLYPLATVSDFSSKKNEHMIRVSYLCKYVKKDIILSEEHSAYKWIPLHSVTTNNYSDMLVATLKVLNEYPNLINI